MAKPGRKQLPPGVHMVNGTHRADRHGEIGTEDMLNAGEPNDLEPPKKLSAAQKVLWDKYIKTAFWLTRHDEINAYLWVTMAAKYLSSPHQYATTRVSQLRAVGSDLGINWHMGAQVKDGKAKGKAGRFFPN